MEYGDYVRVMGSYTYGEPYLPSRPVDVNERVYERLGGDEFEYDGDNSAPLAEFIATLQALKDDAPEGAETVIKFSTSNCYDGEGDAEYEVGYWRDPTAEERAAREETNRKIAERAALNEERAAAKEREMFEHLKAKYEPR